ncbi:L-2-amino-thiazoline-4-carboxylic acid hydrolase [Inediibacterium massiliense]|uniref:L-2-amino-thiazoline-4-carboxylic acid hydrolase n=1 Tax=Inediibacterium massiliense TaxID=1658111 RepID=UPI0006B407B6|nr:L-2-amino-thiazoline-4-carboxylic acid hydrolase [Inediibacterium massiliense]
MDGFTATHHALLFAWISKAVVQAVGEKEGERILRRAVIKYAHQRGKRMALRAKANGDPLTMANYMAYIEWMPQKGEMEQKLVQRSPHTRVNVFKCPWHTAWKENNLMTYGRYFCMEVDKALVEGFNEELAIDVKGTQPNNAKCCDLIFKDAYLTPLNIIKLIYKKLIKPGKKAIMSWEYHSGHLYKTMGEVVGEELGQRAEKVMATGLKNFTDRYGKEAGDIVISYRNTDFDILPKTQVS